MNGGAGGEAVQEGDPSASAVQPAISSQASSILGTVQASDSVAASGPFDEHQITDRLTTSLQMPPTEPSKVNDATGIRSQASEGPSMNVGNAFDAFQSARSAQATSSGILPTASSTNSKSSDGVRESSSAHLQSTAIPTSTPTAETSVGSSSRTGTTQSLETSFEPLVAPTIQALAQSEKSQSPATSLTTPPVISSVIQVPSSSLGIPRTIASTTVPDVPSQTSEQEPPKRQYPDPSEGYAAMAQGYNKIFQDLDRSARCDPKESQQASACVEGYVGKCGVGGMYTLISCPKGQSCYAVPYPDGTGMNIDCYTPEDANMYAAEGLAGKTSQGASVQDTVSKATIPATTAPFSPSSTTVKSDDVSGTTQSAPKTEASTPAILPLSDSTAEGALVDTENPTQTSGSQSITPATAAAHSKSVSQTGGSSSTTTSFKGFPSPIATMERVSEVAAGSTSGLDRPESEDGDHVRHKQSSSKETKPEKQQASPSGDSQSEDKGDAPGVQLSFPGSEKSGTDGAHDEKVSKHPKNKDRPDDAPPVSGKHAVGADEQPPSPEPSASLSLQAPKNALAAQEDASPTSLPTSPSTLAAVRPGITIAPIAAAGRQGFITVTVTQTTTVHD